MIYLTNTDFELQIQDVNLQQIINNNTALLDSAVLLAIAESRSYLAQKFEVDAELLKTNTDRDVQLVTYNVDIALYHLHCRIAPRNIPELRKTRYENAIEWLKLCSEGMVTPAIDKIQPLQGKRNRFGGNEKKINTY
jgi:phage gp36-like protein